MDDVVILFTDGQSNVNYWDTIPAASDLKEANVEVLTVGIALKNNDEINAIASSPQHVFTVSIGKVFVKS